MLYSMFENSAKSCYNKRLYKRKKANLNMSGANRINDPESRGFTAHDIDFVLSSHGVPETLLRANHFSLARHHYYALRVGVDGFEVTPHDQSLVPGYLMDAVLRGRELGALQAGPSHFDVEGNPSKIVHGGEQLPKPTRRDRTIGRIVLAGRAIAWSNQDGIETAEQQHPSIPDALDQLQAIQRVRQLTQEAKPGMPVVLDPSHNDGRVEYKYSGYRQRGSELRTLWRGGTGRETVELRVPFQTRLFQPTRQLLGKWGLKAITMQESSATIPALRTRMSVHGLTGVALDTLDLQTLDLVAATRLTDELIDGEMVDMIRLRLSPTGNAANAEQAFLTSPEAALDTFEGGILWSVVQGWSKTSHEGHPLIVLEQDPLYANERDQTTIIKNLRILASMALRSG